MENEKLKTIKCPHCNEEVNARAIKCRHCDGWISNKNRIKNEVKEKNEVKLIDKKENKQKKKLTESDIFGIIIGFGLAVIISRSYNLGFITLLILTLVFYYISKYISIALGAKETPFKDSKERNNKIKRWAKLIFFSLLIVFCFILILYLSI